MSIKNDVTQLELTPTIKIFCCYDKRNENFWKELKSHLALLKRLGKIMIVDNHIIPAGKNYQYEINYYLDNSNIIILLISHYFFDSDLCWKVLCQAIQKYKAGEIRVIPILLSPVDYEGAPIEELQMLPDDKQPITQWLDPNKAYKNITQGIRETVTILSNRLEERNTDSKNDNSIQFTLKKTEWITIESSERVRLQDEIQGGFEA